MQGILRVGFSPVLNRSTKAFPLQLHFRHLQDIYRILSFSSFLLHGHNTKHSILHASRTSCTSVPPMNLPGCYSGGKFKHRRIWDMSPEKGNPGIHTPVQVLQAPAGKVTSCSQRPTVFPTRTGTSSPEGHMAGDWEHPRTTIPSAALSFTQSRAFSVCA